MSSQNECKQHEYVEIAFEFDKMTPEKQQKVFEAEITLTEAGIFFDTMYDVSDHERIWLFDWTLRGPVHVVPRCVSH